MPNVTLLSPCEQFPLVTFPCPKCSDQNMQASLSPMDWTPHTFTSSPAKIDLLPQHEVILGWEHASHPWLRTGSENIISTKKWQKLLLVPTILPKIDDSTVSILKQSPSRNGTKGCFFYTNLDIRKAHMLPKCEKQQCHKIIYGLAVITHFTPLQTSAYAGKKMVLGLNNIKGYFVL